jgi:RNA-binding protein Musashi
MQFGRVIDATLMMDKDTGRPRGFGFVTFDGEEAVDRALSRPLEIYGKPMEVKRAQPRSTLQQQNEEKKFGRQNDRFGRQNESQGFDQQNPMQAAGMGGAQSGISPAMMAKYWFNMQQYFKQMQTMMTQNVPGQMGMPNPMAGGQMNPAMMAGMMGMGGPGNGSPNSQMMQQGGPPSGMMSPNAMQQMAQQQQQQQQRQQQQAQQQQAQQQPQGGGNDGGAVESQFDRDQYERQRMQGQQYAAQQANYGQGGPTSWDGMYDDTPQPNVPPQGPAQRGGGGYGRGNFTRGARQMNTPPTQPVANAPPNAPTGPKNAGRPGANYRGGGRGSQRGYHPYAR